jgi:hypothetical protein
VDAHEEDGSIFDSEAVQNLSSPGLSDIVYIHRLVVPLLDPLGRDDENFERVKQRPEQVKRQGY